MEGFPRALQGGQGWALGAMSRGHRHGLWPLLGSAQRVPHRDILWLMFGAEGKKAEGKGGPQRNPRGRGAALGSTRKR
jgi:hypothetical protein